MAGKHPEGKLIQSDEGELEFKITPYKGRVIMDWGKLAVDRTNALDGTDALAKLLIEKGLLTREEFMQKISEERATDQRMLQKVE